MVMMVMVTWIMGTMIVKVMMAVVIMRIMIIVHVLHMKELSAKVQGLTQVLIFCTRCNRDSDLLVSKILVVH